MPHFWFLAGALTGLAAAALSAPWLRRIPPLARLTATPLRAAACAAALVAAIIVLYVLQPGLRSPGTGAGAGAGAAAPASFGAAARLFDSATTSGATTGSAAPAAGGDAATPAARVGAGSMENAVVNLEKRLAQGSGSADDWELLAKSFEFLGRPAEAARARAHQLPAVVPVAGSAAPAFAAPAPAAPGGVTISGEVTLDAALSGKAAQGDTLFIVAKSLTTPGIAGRRVPYQRRCLAVQVHARRFAVDDAGAQPCRARAA